MNITDRERQIIKAALRSGAVTEENLFDAGYSEREIRDILSGKEWHILYSNLYDENVIANCQKAISKILGSDWKNNFDYSESRKNGKFELMLHITETDFDKICEEARS